MQRVVVTPLHPHSDLDDLRLGFVADKMREEDKREVLTATGKGPYEALCFALEVSTKCFVALSERERGTLTPIAIFGVAPSKEEGKGVCWFLSIDLTFSEKKHIRKHTPSWLAVLGKGFTELHNVLDARNVEHFRWCLYAGFDQKGIVEINGHPFILITRPV